MSRRVVRACVLLVAASGVVMLGLSGFDHPAMAQAVEVAVREPTDLEKLRAWTIAVAAVLSLIFSVYLYLNQTKKSELKALNEESETKIEELKERFDRFADKIAVREHTHADKLQMVGERLLSVEERLRLAPSGDEFHLLALKVAEVFGDLKAIAADMRALARSQERMDVQLTKDRT